MNDACPCASERDNLLSHLEQFLSSVLEVVVVVSLVRVASTARQVR